MNKRSIFTKLIVSVLVPAFLLSQLVWADTGSQLKLVEKLVMKELIVKVGEEVDYVNSIDESKRDEFKSFLEKKYENAESSLQKMIENASDKEIKEKLDSKLANFRTKSAESLEMFEIAQIEDIKEAYSMYEEQLVTAWNEWDDWDRGEPWTIITIPLNTPQAVVLMAVFAVVLVACGQFLMGFLVLIFSILLGASL